MTAARLLGCDYSHLADDQADAVDELRARIMDGVSAWAAAGGEAPGLVPAAQTRAQLLDIVHLLQDQGDVEDVSLVLDAVLRRVVRELEH